MSDPLLKHTALLGEHKRLGAQIVPFAGFAMPIRYSSIIAEHDAVRTSAGLFDLSHMAQFALRGEHVCDWLEHLTCNRIGNLPPGTARYNILTNTEGGALDDIIIYRLADSYLVIANAVNADKVARHFSDENLFEAVVLNDLRASQSLVAVQGPASCDILAPLFPQARLAELAYYSCLETSFEGSPCVIARTGYTGEDGFEIFLANESSPMLFRQLLERGKPQGLLPAGLGARDILRLEAGMPLYGNELTEEITPLDAGLQWAVKFDKGDFIGRKALMTAHPDRPRIVGFRLQGRVPMRSGYVVSVNGHAVGEVRSAAISPSLDGASIGTLLVQRRYAELGRTLEVEIRGTLYPGTIVQLPFYRRSR